MCVAGAWMLVSGGESGTRPRALYAVSGSLVPALWPERFELLGQVGLCLGVEVVWWH